MGTLARPTHTPTLDEPTSVPFVDPWGLVGEVIANRYRVEGLIGVGGMGSVLRCHHVGLGRDVAVKVLHPERNTHAESSARFTREARSASRLDHPNCVRVLDFGEWQPRAEMPAAKYLAMELVEGQELGWLLREPLPLRKALDYAGQILDGLDHAHARGVVHRDLKPENVIVTKLRSGSELVKLVDFGIAKIIGGAGLDARMTRTGRVFGTPHYMSPEQVSGTDVDGRADLYSTGVLLFQMITGRLPFDADDPTALMGKHLFSEPPPLPSGLPPSLAAVVARLLAKEPVDRYALASQARAELDIAIRELDVPTPPRPRRGRPLPSRAVALGLVLAAGAIGALVWPAAGDDQIAQAGIVPPPPQGSVQRLPSWIGPPALTPVHTGAEDVRELRGIADPRVALIRVDALLKAAPDDARLHLERARILARSGESDRALADYERAIARDPEVVDGRVLAEIAAFAREPVLQPATLDLALQELGTDGLPILVELVADERSALGYRDRHRALAVLADSPAAASVDERRMIALDLEQAAEADAPCLVFAAALAAIERDPVAEYRSPLRRAMPPSAEPRASVQDVALCAALPDRLARVRALVARETETEPSPPAKTAKTKTSNVRVAKRDAGKSRGRTRADKRRRSSVGRLRGLAG